MKTYSQCKQITTGGYRTETVSSFPSLGSIINEENSISTEITHRIKKGNRAYYADHELITCKLIKQHTKKKIYMMLIRPLATRTLSMWDINNLLMFER
jgi:hypothetical protein